jgi:hypothetical protein
MLEHRLGFWWQKKENRRSREKIVDIERDGTGAGTVAQQNPMPVALVGQQSCSDASLA